MKNKNQKLFELFAEERLVFAAGGAVVPPSGGFRTVRPGEAPAGTPEGAETIDQYARVTQFVQELIDLDPTLKGILIPPGADENNLFAGLPVKYFEALNALTTQMDQTRFDFDQIQTEPGKLTLSSGDPSKPTIIIEKEAYLGLFWAKLQKDISSLYPGKTITPEQISGAIDLNRADLQKLLEAWALTDPSQLNYLEPIRTDSTLMNAALADLERAKTPEEQRRITESRLHTERAHQDLERLKRQFGENQAARLGYQWDMPPGQTDFTKQRAMIDKLVSLRSMRELKINPDNWRTNSQQELDRMRGDWEKMGLPAQVGNPFYDGIFYELSKSFLPDRIPKQNGAKPEIRALYMDPANNLDKLKEVDNAFYQAYSYFLAVKDFHKTHEDLRTITDDKMLALDRNKYAEKVTGLVSANWDKFTTAIRNRDYATAGMYILGAWAIYKTVQTVRGTKSGKAWWPWIVGAGAVLMGGEMLKATGFDPWKKLGIFDWADDVRGTPLEGLVNLGIADARKIDSAVYLRTAHFNVAQLYNDYLNTPFSNGDNKWIDPARYASESFYKDFIGKVPEDRVRDEQYRHVGEQLYIIASCLVQGYDKTLKSREGNPYFGITFENAIAAPNANDPHHSISNEIQIIDFVGVLTEYKPFETGRYDFTAAKQTQERMTKMLEGTRMGLRLDMMTREGDDQALNGTLMGLPIVVVFDPLKQLYLIYFRRDYLEQKGIMDQSLALGSLPMDPQGEGVEAKVATLKEAIETKMQTLLAPISAQNGRLLKPPRFMENGEWQCEIELPESKTYGFIKKRPSTATITVLEDGSLIITDKVLGLEIQLNYFYDEANPESAVLFAHMVSPSNLALLAPFYKAKKIKFVEQLPDLAPGVHEFTMEVAGTVVKVKCDETSGTPKFEISLEDQKKLLENPEFRRTYAEAATESKKVREVFDKLRKLIDKAPENFHFFFFKGAWRGLAGIELDAPFRNMSLDFASGSVPDYFTKSVLEAKRMSLMYGLQGSLMNVDNFVDAQKEISRVWADPLAQLEEVADRLLSGPMDSATWERDEFMMRIVEPINRAGHKSTAYTGIVEEFQAEAMQKFDLKGSDFFKGPHQNLQRLMAAFAYYTAHVDTKEMDSLSYPVPTGATADVLDKYYRAGYMRYVYDEIMGQFTTEFNGVAPSPESYQGIMQYKEWKQSPEAVLEPFNTIDALGPFEHNRAAAVAAGRPTELEKEFQDKFTAMIEDLKKIHGFTGSINEPAVEQYKYDFLNTPTTTGLVQIEIETDYIHGTYGRLRSLEIRAIDRRIDAYRWAIINSDKYWDKMTLWERVKAIFH